MEAYTPLSRTFYRQDGCSLAKGCLGKLLVRQRADGILCGIVAETEAYMGVIDRASHAYGGRRTERNSTMYRDAGYAYVYRIYGLYCCLNFTAATEGNPEAVLVRSVVPVEGISLMNQNRMLHGRGKTYPATGSLTQRDKLRMTEGPGRLYTAMDIGMDWNGVDLTDGYQPSSETDRLYLADVGLTVSAVDCLPRVGIDYAGEDRDKPWRFVVSKAEQEKILAWANTMYNQI